MLSLTLKTLKFVAEHPLNRRRPIAALLRFTSWQLRSRLRTEHVHNWVDGTKLIVRKGMSGATGNIYCGLHEFADMAFLLHVLEPKDVFLDVGANVGSYTVLASGVCGARTIAFEPDPYTAEDLRRNVELNALNDLVEIHEVALGSAAGEIAFTVGLGPMNRIAVPGEPSHIVAMRRLDDIPGARKAIVIKLDVEGNAAEVLAGGCDVLASPTLLAVEIEDPCCGLKALTAAGFLRRWYDPWSRTLLQKPPDNLNASNELFVRDEESVLNRLQIAPRRCIHGQDL